MPETLTDCDWLVRIDNPTAPPVLQHVHAAYHRFVDDRPFIEFKDAQHKVVLTVSQDRVLSIQRADSLTSAVTPDVSSDVHDRPSDGSMHAYSTSCPCGPTLCGVDGYGRRHWQHHADVD